MPRLVTHTEGELPETSACCAQLHNSATQTHPRSSQGLFLLGGGLFFLDTSHARDIPVRPAQLPSRCVVGCQCALEHVPGVAVFIAAGFLMDSSTRGVRFFSSARISTPNAGYRRMAIESVERAFLKIILVVLFCGGLLLCRLVPRHGLLYSPLLYLLHHVHGIFALFVT